MGDIRFSILGLFLFFVSNMIYWELGDRENPYWDLAFTIPFYLMILFFLFFILARIENKGLRRTIRTKIGILVMSIFFFLSMIVVHLMCFINIELYESLVGYVGFWGVGSWLLVSGLLVLNLYVRAERIINYIKTKSHGCTKI